MKTPSSKRSSLFRAWSLMTSGACLILLSPWMTLVLFMRFHALPPEGVYRPGELLDLLGRPGINLTDAQLIVRMLPFICAGILLIFFGLHRRQKVLGQV